jgi:uncharacterized membrane protein
MASKYDTNPLDPDFPKKAAHSQHTETPRAEAARTEALPNLDAETRQFAGSVTAEDPTRRYNNGNFDPYAYAQPQGQSPAAYQAAHQIGHLPENEKPSNRKIQSLGLPENVLMVLPYAPFFIGLIASILELLLVPQSETKVRFHAAQGLAAHVAILAVTFILGFIGNFSSWANTGSKIFGLITFILLIISMIKVWKGKPLHFEALDSLTNWFSDKIKSQKQ